MDTINLLAFTTIGVSIVLAVIALILTLVEPGTAERTDECHPSLFHSLPRPSRWSRIYACIAISKGHVIRDNTRWPEIRQQFGRSAKTAPRKG